MSQEDTNTGWQGEMSKTAKAIFEYIELRKKNEKREAAWLVGRRVFFATLFASAIFSYVVSLQFITGGTSTPKPTSNSVAVIPINGEIMSTAKASAENVVPLIEEACKNEKVKTIVLSIDSPGGSPLESERIIAALGHCSPADKHKPVYSLIGTLGASAAYMIAMHTDKIFAGKYAIVGSIGAVMRYVDASELATRLGLAEKVFRSGPLKGGPSMMTPTSDGDAKVNDELVSKLGQGFLADVIKCRGEHLKVGADDLKSGRVWTSDEALAMGLIDQQAVMEDLKATEFKDLKVVEYNPRPSIAKWMGAEEVLRDVLSDMITPKVR